jgi:hypothetical protein
VNLIWLAAVSFVMVFAAAFQSKSVNGGHYASAAVGSIFIGFSQAVIWRATTASEGWLEVTVYSIAGGLGCVTAMWTHSRFIKPKETK